VLDFRIDHLFAVAFLAVGQKSLSGHNPSQPVKSRYSPI
jgi:hypothetical protein